MSMKPSDRQADRVREVLRKYQDLPQFAQIELKDVNQQGFDEDTPLHVACRQGSAEDVEVMIAGGADVLKPGDLGNTPLHEAAAYGHAEIVRSLLEAGADPNLVNEFGKSARDRAAQEGHKTVVEVFDRWGRGTQGKR
jgi:ankyrin repeat protein